MNTEASESLIVADVDTKILHPLITGTMVFFFLHFGLVSNWE